MKSKVLFLSALAFAALTGCSKTPETTDTDPTQYEITVTAPVNGTIAVTAADGTAVEKAEAGATITITATPAGGYDFVKWTVTGATPASTTASTTTFEMPEGAVTVAAEFAEILYNITVTPPTNGTVEVKVNNAAAEKAAPGATVTIVATPAAGYDFDGWTVSGATPASTTEATTTFTMPSTDVTVAAAFVKTEYTITVTPPTNGTINVGANGAEVTKATEGTEITIVATPATDYMFSKWTITGATPADANKKMTTFIMPAANVTVAAEFKVDNTKDTGVVIGGLKWATRNVDKPGTFAETPRSNGLFYQWNRRTAWSVTSDLVSWAPDGTENTEPTWDNTIPTGDAWEDLNSPCPVGWRLPTEAEYTALKSAVNTSVEAAADGNYQATKMVDKNDETKVLYFPNAGQRQSATTLYSQGTMGAYWTSDKAVSANNALYTYLYGASFMNSNGIKSTANNVRCVEKAQ